MNCSLTIYFTSRSINVDLPFLDFFPEDAEYKVQVITKLFLKYYQHMQQQENVKKLFP